MGKDTQGCKLGLALSGGGFRAALYHIGVLAQLADRGLLKHIEVISSLQFRADQLLVLCIICT